MSRYIDYDAIDYRNDKMHDKSSDFIDGVIYMAQRIEDAPSIDIEPKRGEWKRRLVDNGFNADWVCSECGYRVKTDFVDYNYCPNCGCAMTKE